MITRADLGSDPAAPGGPRHVTYWHPRVVVRDGRAEIVMEDGRAEIVMEAHEEPWAGFKYEEEQGNG